MSESPFALSAAPTVQVSAELEPAANVLFSLWGMTAADVVSVDPWVTQCAALLSPEQRAFNHLLFAAFGPALLPAEPFTDFPSYLDALATRTPAQFRERLPRALSATLAPTLRTAAEALLADPSTLQHQVVNHLGTLWDTLLASEWQRHTYLLTKMTRTINELIFSQSHWQAADAFAALRYLLQTEPSDRQLAQLAGVTRIVLVWSPHLLGHCTHLDRSDTLWVVRKFDPQLLRRDPLRRAEVLGPLSALADDTRLRILELLVEHGEQRAQEIIVQLESSQGNISRHLKQLSGAGFVRERRAGDANKLYVFDAAGLQRLMFLLRQLLSTHNVQGVGQAQALETRLGQVRAITPQALHDLLDEQGRVTRWSSKQKEQEAMLGYLVEKFERERGYSEREVNDLLQLWYLDADFVLVRRSLVDTGLLRRTKDGARYWRE